jgi:glucose-1-phosphate thymidylyltransferase
LVDNIFRDPLVPLVEKANSRPDWAWIGLKQVPDPGRYGVAELNGDAVVSIVEKPKEPKSDLAVVGIYIYPPDVFNVIKTLKPSGRGELEITDVNNYYLKQGRMGWSRLDGYWTDAGTLDSLDHANELVRKEAPRF